MNINYSKKKRKSISISVYNVHEIKFKYENYLEHLI